MSRYGTSRLATVSPSDVEIYYTYTPNRETKPDGLINSLVSTDVLTPYNSANSGVELFGGLYSLTLPAVNFNKLGIYNIVIRPKQIRTKIIDCGSLFSLPNEKGIVLDLVSATENNGNAVDMSTLVSNMTGYRVEYLNDDNTLKQNYFTIVTTANKAELVSNNSTNTTQKSVAYRLNDSGSLIFLTVSPSTINNVTPNQRPFIGIPNQNIILTNTYFNPIMLEVELVEYTENEIGVGLFSSQVIDEQNGVISWYDSDKNIYKQALLYVIEDELGKPLVRVREAKTQIDNTQDFDTVTNV
jgi:hypothetical protein